MDGLWWKVILLRLNLRDQNYKEGFEMDRVDHNRMVKRLFMVLSGWILGGTLVFSQNHPVAIVQKEAYFPMKEVCLLDSPCLLYTSPSPRDA